MYLCVWVWGLRSGAGHWPALVVTGVENVTIQLDLESAFYFTHLVMTFKVTQPESLLCTSCPGGHQRCLPLVTQGPLPHPRRSCPAALNLEQSVDHGCSWHVYQYFAHNCSRLFPGIPLAPGHRVGDLVSDQHYSDIEPPTEDKVRPRGRGFGPWSEARGSGLLLPQVIFKVLDPAILVENPNDPKIQGNSPSQSWSPCVSEQPKTGGRRGPAWVCATVRQGVR